MKTKYVYKNVLLDNGQTTDVRFNVEVITNAVKDRIKYLPTGGFTVTCDELMVSDSSIEMFQDETFVLHIFTQKCEELTSFRTTLPLDVSRLN